MSIAMGGHVRVGLEDGIYMDAEKRDLATNARMVERVVRVAAAMDRPIASPIEIRTMLGLPLHAAAPKQINLAISA
jgi:uncharacterized protein (DUF849 family)